ncbi:MAG: enoyl-CoA hydratase/isomerase family protein [Candidatus Wallbacteria bacterium]|nr:enoyl-CoA hydratase/isomerase family protein [Candidatus Wallbacteria bacterium]
MTPYETLLLERSDKIALLTVNRPAARNALGKKTVEEMHHALAELASAGEGGVLILTGAGEKSFVAGADIGELRGRGKREALQGINQDLFTAVENFPWPVIAAVNGHALGGGCELALACDLRVASEEARFGLPETGLGILPGAGGTQRLPRLIGWGRAKEMILTGQIVDAREAERIGLVSRVVPREALLDTARDYALKMLARGPLALRLAKLALNMSARTGLDSGLQIERLAQAILFESKDKLEGMTAFLEKRKPEFTGE